MDTKNTIFGDITKEFETFAKELVEKKAENFSKRLGITKFYFVDLMEKGEKLENIKSIREYTDEELLKSMKKTPFIFREDSFIEELNRRGLKLEV